MPFIISIFIFALIGLSLWQKGVAVNLPNLTAGNTAKEITGTTTPPPNTTTTTTTSTKPVTKPKATTTKPAVVPTSTSATSTPKSTTTANPPDVNSVGPVGIIFYTNEERNERDLPELRSNPVLEAIAKARVMDMIEKNYFDHVNPDGENVSDVAARMGYPYSYLGENLAMGDFRSSEQMVTGWMNSPGHRGNILNPNYVEIGVAAAYAEIKGRKQWISAQIFGKQFGR